MSAKLLRVVQLDEEIATRPWGERSFHAADPFGNRICFVDETTAFTTREGPR